MGYKESWIIFEEEFSFFYWDIFLNQIKLIIRVHIYAKAIKFLFLMKIENSLWEIVILFHKK